jgi:hypothetical protein
MANPPSSSSAPLTEDAFIADRQKFLSSFIGFTTGSVIFVAVLLILLAIFLL